MKRFVDGEEVELAQEGEVERLADRLLVRSPEGVFSAAAVRVGDAVLVSYRGRQYRIERSRPRVRGAAGAGSGEIRATMPGQIAEVLVTAGASVAQGQTLVVLEAMKTHQPLTAPFDGIVTQVGVIKGQQVAEGQLLALVLPAESADTKSGE